ncbi:type I restriction endonuclease subunit R [Halomicronema hongdechloris]|nr:type I restriction endonuclease subunit R [Halomicronema hongdechloris]
MLAVMVTAGITQAITNLNEARTKLGVAPSQDAAFFLEWQAPLPSLTDAQKVRLDHLKQRYLFYADSGAITEGTVNLILLAPLLETLSLMDPPYQVRGEKYVRVAIEDGETMLEGLIDALLLDEHLWLIVIESKRYGFSGRQAIAQTLGYMVTAPVSPVFALITTGEDFLFVKLDRETGMYGLSDKFTLSTVAGNDLHQVAQILQRLAAH